MMMMEVHIDGKTHFQIKTDYAHLQLCQTSTMEKLKYNNENVWKFWKCSMIYLNDIF